MSGLLEVIKPSICLSCLADDKAQDRKVSEGHKNKEIMELRQGMDRHQIEINRLNGLHQKVEHLFTEKTQEPLALSEEKDKLLGEKRT